MNSSTEQHQGREPLPCLNSNNSTKTNRLSTQHRKTAYNLKQSVALLASRYGIEHLGFLTLTFREHITCPKEAQRRLNSLLTHVIRERYEDYICVLERQKSGRIHYHLIVVTRFDLRKGVNFEEMANGVYKSAGSSLRREWAFWRNTAPKYGFGRTELLPIRSNESAISKYVGKYISKHIEARKEEDKGVRLVRYSQGAKSGTTRFSFYSPGSIEWRRKVKAFAELVSRTKGVQINELSDLSRHLNKRWAYHHRDFILAIP